MSLTARDMLKGSLRLIGVLASGETPSADEQTEGLLAMRGMLASWAAEGLLAHAVIREEFTLTSGQGSRTMGTGGNFNTDRPVEILRATLEDQSATPTIEYPLEIVNTDEWVDVGQKDLTSTLPRKLYPQWSHPLLTLNLWPVPTAANKLVLYTKKELVSIASANTTIDLPPGYEEAIRYGLAVRLAPEYGKSVAAEVAAVATEAKANVMRQNIKPEYLTPDAGCPGMGEGTYNIFTGG